MKPSIAVLAFLLAGCASDHALEYAERHPGWQRSFPREEIGIDELLASIHVPSPGRQTLTQVTRRRVIGLGTTPWEVVPDAVIRAGGFRAEPGRLYVVAAEVECFWKLYRRMRMRKSFSWYVLRDDRLLAYRHTEYAERCEAEDLIHGSAHAVDGFEERIREYLAEPVAAPPETR